MAEDDTQQRHRPPQWPTWLITVVGVGLTLTVLVWLSATYDTRGNSLLGDNVAKILVAGVGGTITAIVALAQRGQARIRHQVENSHGTNFRDDLDDARREISAVRTLAERALGASQKTADDTGQLREDVQQLRVEVGGTASDIRGMRKDIGALTKAVIVITKESKES